MTTINEVKKRSAREANEHEQLKLSYLDMQRELDAMRNKFEQFYNDVKLMRERQEVLKESFEVIFESCTETKVDQQLNEIRFFLFEKMPQLRKAA